MGGEVRCFIDQDGPETRRHWLECARAGGGNDGGQERPFPLESFLNAVHTAAYLGVKLSTLYAWGAVPRIGGQARIAPHLLDTDPRERRYPRTGEPHPAPR